jgi:hypothetical protein
MVNEIEWLSAFARIAMIPSGLPDGEGDSRDYGRAAKLDSPLAGQSASPSGKPDGVGSG